MLTKSRIEEKLNSLLNNIRSCEEELEDYHKELYLIIDDLVSNFTDKEATDEIKT